MPPKRHDVPLGQVTCPSHVAHHEPLSLWSPRPAKLPGGPLGPPPKQVPDTDLRLWLQNAAIWVWVSFLGPLSPPCVSKSYTGPSVRPIVLQPWAMDALSALVPKSWTLLPESLPAPCCHVTFLPPGELLRDSTLVFSFSTKCF